MFAGMISLQLTMDFPWDPQLENFDSDFAQDFLIDFRAYVSYYPFSWTVILPRLHICHTLYATSHSRGVTVLAIPKYFYFRNL